MPRDPGSCRSVCGCILFCAVLLCPAVLRAEVVTEVRTDGVLLFQDGSSVRLAGITMDEFGVTVLRILAMGKNVKTVREDALATVGSPTPVYAYLRTRILPFPVTANAGREEEVLLNAFLVTQGAARVDEGRAFAEKDRFLMLQENARAAGMGIWSYEKS